MNISTTDPQPSVELMFGEKEDMGIGAKKKSKKKKKKAKKAAVNEIEAEQ
jgi:hypothetical protein